MVTEFNRYNLSKYRQFIGSSQIAASLGLVCGFYFPALGKAAAGGLAVQMFCGVLVRIHIKDSFAQIFPALFFFILNLFIALV